MTYLEALGALQQRGVDALKVAQSTHIATLQSTRECIVALTGSRPAEAPLPALASNVSALATSFTLGLVEQQIAYAHQLSSMLLSPAVQATQAAEAQPVATDVPSTDGLPESVVHARIDTEAMASEQATILAKALPAPAASIRNINAPTFGANAAKPR